MFFAMQMWGLVNMFLCSTKQQDSIVMFLSCINQKGKLVSVFLQRNTQPFTMNLNVVYETE